MYMALKTMQSLHSTGTSTSTSISTSLQSTPVTVASMVSWGFDFASLSFSSSRPLKKSENNSVKIVSFCAAAGKLVWDLRAGWL